MVDGCLLVGHGVATVINCPPTPCNTCPYRRDTPPGIWDISEYLKLREYDAGGFRLEVFHCHQERITGKPTICRGWLSCHKFESMAIRWACHRGAITEEQVNAPCPAPLYKSGEDACFAGIKGLRRPSKKAKAVIQKLINQGFK